jgi:hypothetical protein
MPTPPNETIELRAQQLDRTPLAPFRGEGAGGGATV